MKRTGRKLGDSSDEAAEAESDYKVIIHSTVQEDSFESVDDKDHDGQSNDAQSEDGLESLSN